jgi:5-methyltetrahydropteroyltriglutamate--homocysteine methyltransferase
MYAQTLVDDIGSFPLPPSVDRKSFDKAYTPAREAIIAGEDITKNDFLHTNFYDVVLKSFELKLGAGLDVVNYSQHYDMNNQFLDPIHRTMGKGTRLVEEKHAIIPEVYVINEEAKRLSEEFGKISLRVCITGPMELYLKEMKTTILYKEILLTFAENFRRFARNSILDSKYIETKVISIDEPSWGYWDIDADADTLLDVLEKALDFKGVVRQIHLHSPAMVKDLLELKKDSKAFQKDSLTNLLLTFQRDLPAVKNLDVLSFEYAGSPKHIESVSKNMLERADKRIRVGISRTDMDSAEDEEIIRKRFHKAKEKFGDTMTFTGPDCGLGGWPTQEAAQLLLKRTVNAVKSNA